VDRIGYPVSDRLFLNLELIRGLRIGSGGSILTRENFGSDRVGCLLTRECFGSNRMVEKTTKQAEF